MPDSPLPVEAPAPLPRLGDFEILREIGRGGMGVVYEARQLSLNRRVALKVLSGGIGMAPRAVERFKREAEAAAKLHHTNIVPVYATGEQGGVHFYAMELIDCPSLDQVIRQIRPGQPTAAGRTTPTQAAPDADLVATGPYGASPTATPAGPPTPSPAYSGGDYFDWVASKLAEVADALEHAHRQGVVHRDVKPSNLLLCSDGRICVNDFGLARILEQPGMTVTGEFLGTPAYMSPEQVTGGRAPVDHRTDVYSLGATLYELLTLHIPFDGERRDEVLAQIVQAEPRRPRELQPAVPIDLETICLKALEKDPRRRYQTAGAMAGDLRRFVKRFAIAARRAGPVERLRKWVRRHPSLSVALAAVALAAVLVGFFAHQAHRAEQRRREEQRRHDEELQAERRQRALDDAVAAALSGDVKRSEEAVRAAERHGASPGEVRFLRGLVHFHSTDVKAAVEDLEQARRLLPDSVAARALLAAFYYRVYDMPKVQQLEDELSRLEPRTPEDYLFKGYLQSVSSPDLALPTLDEAIRRRDTPVSRLIRAEVRGRYALERSDREAAARAEEDGRVARSLLPDHPFALTASASAHLVAAILHKENDDGAGRKAALAEMERDVRELERFPQFRGSGWYRSLYFSQVGDAAAASRVLRRAADGSESNQVLVAYAADCYRRGEIEEALQVLARRKDKEDWGGDLLRVYLLAEQKGGGPARAYEALAAWRRQYPAPVNLTLGVTSLLLLGRKAEAQALMRGNPLPDRPVTEKRKVFLERYWAYASGERTSEELLRSAKDARSYRCSSHYLIGMTCLASGDREGARVHLRRCLDNKTFRLFIEYVAEAVVARLEKDSAWPPWVPAGK